MGVRCPVCGESFETDLELEQHEHELPEAWEGAGAGFECPTCGAMFSEEEELVAHQATAHPTTSEG
jgi:uncharacterized C2H2 Zn-finger protein